MKVRTTLLATALACALAAPLAASARSNFSINVDVAPPAPPVYAPLPPRAGYIVTPGYYRYDTDQHRHNWVKSGYVRERHGQHYVGPAWHEDNGRYHFNQGHWDHD